MAEEETMEHWLLCGIFNEELSAYHIWKQFAKKKAGSGSGWGRGGDGSGGLGEPPPRFPECEEAPR